MKQLFSEVFTQFSIPHFISLLLNIMFAWNFISNVSRFCYRPASVFKDFTVGSHMIDSEDCICNSSKRLIQFLDPDTMDISNGDSKMHVCTMDTKIIHNHGLREAVTLGLNHIPLRNTTIRETVQVIVDTFGQICLLLKVDELIDVDMASKVVRAKSRDKLVSAMKEFFLASGIQNPTYYLKKQWRMNYHGS